MRVVPGARDQESVLLEKFHPLFDLSIPTLFFLFERPPSFLSVLPPRPPSIAVSRKLRPTPSLFSLFAADVIFRFFFQDVFGPPGQDPSCVFSTIRFEVVLCFKLLPVSFFLSDPGRPNKTLFR